MPGFLTKALNNREFLGLNSILLSLGPRGVGKSYFLLKIAEERDKTFSIDRVCFDLETFLDTLNLLKGGYQWILFDEMGLEIPAREWLSTANKIMSYVTQSFRFTKVNLGISTPSPDYVDIHARQLADFWCIGQTRGVMRIYSVKSSPFKRQSLMTPYLGNLLISLPSKELQEDYELKRKEVLHSKYADYLREMQQKREKKEELMVDPQARFNRALEAYNSGRLFAMSGRGKGVLSAKAIQVEMGVSNSTSYVIKEQLERYLANKQSN